MARQISQKVVRVLPFLALASLVVFVLLAAQPQRQVAAQTAFQYRNVKFNTYDYSCSDWPYPGGVLKWSFFLGQHHFVYEGWNYEYSFDGGKTWHYAYSWVYPFNQGGPFIITRQWEYWAPFLPGQQACPPRISPSQ
jgi:hypothetical protein